MKRLLAGASGLIVLLIIGCGSGGDTSSNARATIPRSAYAKQADMICGRTEQRQVQLMAKFGKRKSSHRAQLELIEFAGIPPLREQAKELGELPAPTAGADEAQAFVSAFRAAVTKSEENPGAMLEAPSSFAEAEAAAKKFGFKVCGGA
jgi:hypothetical protein